MAIDLHQYFNLVSLTINMALCSRCLAIPFNSLPQLLAFWDITGQTFRTHELPQVQSYHYNVETSQRQIGYPWHPELSSLAASAPGCALCGVIYQGFQRWRDTFDAARAEIRRTLNRLPYNDEIPEGQVLYLTQRPEGVPGLNILVRVPPKLEFFYVLPGVAFSVDEGMPFNRVWTAGGSKYSTYQVICR